MSQPDQEWEEDIEPDELNKQFAALELALTGKQGRSFPDLDRLTAVVIAMSQEQNARCADLKNQLAKLPENFDGKITVDTMKNMITMFAELNTAFKMQAAEVLGFHERLTAHGTIIAKNNDMEKTIAEDLRNQSRVQQMCHKSLADELRTKLMAIDDNNTRLQQQIDYLATHIVGLKDVWEKDHLDIFKLKVALDLAVDRLTKLEANKMTRSDSSMMDHITQLHRRIAILERGEVITELAHECDSRLTKLEISNDNAIIAEQLAAIKPKRLCNEPKRLCNEPKHEEQEQQEIAD